jgi:hypothetical protein
MGAGGQSCAGCVNPFSRLIERIWRFRQEFAKLEALGRVAAEAQQKRGGGGKKT